MHWTLLDWNKSIHWANTVSQPILNCYLFVRWGPWMSWGCYAHKYDTCGNPIGFDWDGTRNLGSFLLICRLAVHGTKIWGRKSFDFNVKEKVKKKGRRSFHGNHTAQIIQDNHKNCESPCSTSPHIHLFNLDTTPFSNFTSQGLIMPLVNSI